MIFVRSLLWILSYPCHISLTWVKSNPTWISNHMSSRVRDEITDPYTNLTGTTVDVCEWISNFIPHFIMYVIIYDITYPTTRWNGIMLLWYLLYNIITHWCRMTHICVSKLTITVSDMAFLIWENMTSRYRKRLHLVNNSILVFASEKDTCSCHFDKKKLWRGRPL